MRLGILNGSLHLPTNKVRSLRTCGVPHVAHLSNIVGNMLGFLNYMKNTNLNVRSVTLKVRSIIRLAKMATLSRVLYFLMISKVEPRTGIWVKPSLIYETAVFFFFDIVIPAYSLQQMQNAIFKKQNSILASTVGCNRFLN